MEQLTNEQSIRLQALQLVEMNLEYGQEIISFVADSQVKFDIFRACYDKEKDAEKAVALAKLAYGLIIGK